MRSRRHERGLSSWYALVVAGPFSFLILLGWAVVTVVAILFLPPMGAPGGSFADLTPRNTPAIAAELASARQFRVPVLSRVAVVQHDPGGLSPAAQAQTVRAAVDLSRGATSLSKDLVAAFPLINDPRLFSGAQETGTTAITYLFFEPSVDWWTRRRLAESYAATYLDRSDAAVVGVTGSILARLAQGTHINARLVWVELATVVMIALIVGLTFGSLLAPVATLLTGMAAYVVATRVLAWLGLRYGFEPPAELEPLIVVLLLGIVTDYAIFYLSGMRAHLRAGELRSAAARSTTMQYTRTILTAGLMVAAGTCALVVATQHFFRAFGPGMAVTVLIGLGISVTLFPALLATLGSALFWPRGVRPASAATADVASGGVAPADPVQDTPSMVSMPRRTLSVRLAHIATHRAAALLIVVACVAVLVVAASGLRETRLGLDFVTSLPAGDDVRRAAVAASDGFAAGILSPTQIVLEQPGITRRGGALSSLEGAIARQPGVAAVIGPREQPVAAGLGIVKSRDGAAARYLVVFAADPLGGIGIARYNELQDAMPGLLRKAGLQGAGVRYAGDTALAAYSVKRTLTDLVRIAIAVSLVDLLLLMLFLRSLVAPLYLLAASVLALAASLGLTTFVFQTLLGQEDLTYYVPFAASVLLISLGGDYTIFLVGRIWAERRVRPLRSAIETAVPRARQAISIAALALASSFAMLAIVDLASFRELAFLLAGGVLIDAFFVRSLLVPALIALFGRTRAAQGVSPLPPSGRPLR